MTVHAVVLGLSALAVLALHDGQGRGVSPASDASRAADLAARHSRTGAADTHVLGGQGVT